MAEDAAVFVDGDFEPAQNPEKTVEAAQKSFNKTGGTDFSLQSLEVFNPHNLFVYIHLNHHTFFPRIIHNLF